MWSVEGILDPKHPQILEALGPYQDKVDITCVIDERAPDVLIPRLKQAATVYADEIGARFRERQVMRYLASTITPKDGESNDTALFFLPGAFGTSPANAHTVAALYREVSTWHGEPIRLAAALSSSFSKDTLSHPLISTTEVRAANQAVLIEELLRQYQCGRMWLFGHSRGGLEGMYVLPALKKLIREDNLSTRVDGLILVQSGGLFRQNPLDFLKRHFAKPIIDEAARFIYPNEVETTKMEVLRRRIVGILTGADLRGRDIPLKSYLQIIMFGLADLNPAPDQIRKQIDVPVGVIWGENDNYFPAKLAQKRIEEWGLLFPNSPCVKIVVEANWPHLGLVVDTSRFSELTIRLMQDLIAGM